MANERTVSPGERRGAHEELVDPEEIYRQTMEARSAAECDPAKTYECLLDELRFATGHYQNRREDEPAIALASAVLALEAVIRFLNEDQTIRREELLAPLRVLLSAAVRRVNGERPSLFSEKASENRLPDLSADVLKASIMAAIDVLVAAGCRVPVAIERVVKILKLCGQKEWEIANVKNLRGNFLPLRVSDQALGFREMMKRQALLLVGQDPQAVATKIIKAGI